MVKNNTNNVFIKFFKKIYLFLTLIVSISGYVPKHATKIRTIAMLIALSFSVYLIKYQQHNFKLAIFYFLISEILYLGFITIVLRKDGYRNWFIKKWGKEKGYLVYEGVLGFIFFNNAASIGYVASSIPGNLFHFISKEILLVLVVILFISGFIVKIWSAKVVSIDIYYWKDMFLGRKISEFVVKGPYKYLRNPMYGVGQLPAYAVAIWYGSIFGLIVAILNQCLVFSFYYAVEKKFIKRVYQNKKDRLN
jgi:protein-S-isoprenylcysteine O-methyltransferase Ste14